MRAEQIQTRIEGYTSTLSHAVQGGNGAQFSMLLSLIHSNQQLLPSEKSSIVTQGNFQLPHEDSSYPNINELYTSEVTDRLNGAFNYGLSGDLAYVNGYLYTHSNTPKNRQLASDEYAKIGLMSAGQLMLEEIEKSDRQIRVAA